MAAVARRLLGEPNRRLSTPRELRFGRCGSLAVALDRGVWRDHEAGVGGGVLDLVVHAGAARTRAEAARLLEGEGVLTPRELSPHYAHAREAEAVREAERKRGVAIALWRAGGPPTGTAGEAYLRTARGVAGPLNGAELRFLTAAPLTPLPAGRAHRSGAGGAGGGRARRVDRRPPDLPAAGRERQGGPGLAAQDGGVPWRAGR